MSIRQYDGRCWELRPFPADAERYGHYTSREDAMTAIREAKRDDDYFDPKTRPVLMDAPCWIVQCDGECEYILDEEDEGWVFHHLTRAAAMETAAVYGFRLVGDRVFCEDDAPEDAKVVLTPAEQEAAGQLVIPGVLP